MAGEHIFPLSAQQTTDVARWLAVFSAADSDDTAPGLNWGDGHRAVLNLDRVPIKTDALGTEENLGWIQRDDFGWTFTQIDNTTKEDN